MRRLCQQSPFGQKTLLARFRLIYRLTFDEQGVVVAAGRPGARFLADVRDIAALHGIGRGALECKGRGRHARLLFSRDFPASGRQAIRNVWTPPTAPGPGDGQRARG